MKVFVIIVSYCAEKFIERTLNSVLASTINLEIIVVDNDSCDKTVEVIIEFNSVRLIQNKKNIGFGRACNQGMSLALKEGADYVVLLNQDTEIYPDTIEKLIQIHKKNPSFGILSPLQLDKDNKPAGLVYHWFLKSNRSFFDDLFFNNLQELYEVSFVSASFWLIPKEILVSVGGFNPLYFMYGEDTQYIYRVLGKGFKIGIAAKIYYKHYKINFYEKTFWKQILEVRNSFITHLSNPYYKQNSSFTNHFKSLVSRILSRIVFFKFRLALVDILGIIYFLASLSKILNLLKKEKSTTKIYL